MRRAHTVRRLGLRRGDVLHVVAFRVLRACRQRLAHAVAGAGRCLELVLRVVVARRERRALAVHTQCAFLRDVLAAGVRVRVRDAARLVRRADAVRGARTPRVRVLRGGLRRTAPRG